MVTRSKTEYSFLHPQKKKAIRGLKLGNNYTKKEIDIVIETNRNRNNGNAVGTVTRTERGKTSGIGDVAIEGSVSAVERELQRLDKQAEYAHRGLDFEREELRERERLEREQAERERIERSRRDEELARRNEEVKQNDSDGNKRRNKANTNYFGK